MDLAARCRQEARPTGRRRHRRLPLVRSARGLRGALTAAFRQALLLLLPLFLAGGCADRDNPFDPVNRAARTPDSAAVVEPRPGPTSLVVDPDSARRNAPFYGTLGTALTQVKPGDTIWIQGGRTYLLQDVLNVSKGGTFVAPVVIRSFGGQARFAPARSGILNLLRVSQPYVHLRGLAFVGAEGDGVLVNNSPGPVRLDSVRIDSCGVGGSGSALRAGPAGVRLGLSDLTMRHNASRPALVLETGAVIDDSLRVLEIPRP